MIFIISHAAFIHALNNSDRRFVPSGTTYEVDGCTIGTSIKPEQLVTADIEAWKVEYEAEEIVQPLGEDPFVCCPVCAKSTRETLNDGESRVTAVCN